MAMRKKRKRTRYVRILLTPAEERAWTAAARVFTDGNVSSYVRSCVNDDQRTREHLPATTPQPEIPPK